MKLRYKKYYTINGIEEHNCKLCGFEYDENRSLSTHLQFKHKDYTTQKYYDEFYKKKMKENVKFVENQQNFLI